VLTRIGLSESFAGAARNAVEAGVIGGIVGQAPYGVLGRGVTAVMDEEDGSVLDAAVAAGSDLLVTNNLNDFAPGARADIDAESVRMDGKGRPDVLLLRQTQLPHGLVIASVCAARAWLVDGTRPPAGLLERFRLP
jgi:hypothetical protein